VAFNCSRTVTGSQGIRYKGFGVRGHGRRPHAAIRYRANQVPDARRPDRLIRGNATRTAEGAASGV